ncbi:MAG TPA: hypothetical protein VMI75_21640 [Polyangiaceae bacterium]|nr:hypothetical protein [Polyangiaceae bacterium]
MTARFVIVAAGVLAAAAATACTATAKREADTLASAVEAYRRTEGPMKPARARAVSEVSCSDARVCDAKALCVAAVDATTQALALKDEVAARVGDIEHGTLDRTSPEAQALPGKLDEAERLLKEGRDKMRACDEKLAKLRLEVGG